ncbi:MAG: nucleotidyltransferase domain-containing protein [Tunicatimonas sp.]
MEELIVRRLHTALPSLRAVYLFGSVVTEHFTEDSDIDVAVLTSEPMDALLRWKLIQQLAIALNRDVDLVDLSTASTVMQFQVVSTGERIFTTDVSAMEWWELKIYQLYLTLNDDRKPILEAIQQTGRIYGD